MQLRTIPCRFTFRGLLVFTAFIALTLASMRFGGWLANVTLSCIALWLSGLLIIALVDRARRRAYAIGFLVPVIVYGGIHGSTNRDQLSTHDTFTLPTTRAFQRYYRSVAVTKWIDREGNETADFDPSSPWEPKPSEGDWKSEAVSMTIRDKPDGPTFMLLGHSLLAITLGFLGSRFALYVYDSQDHD